MLSDSVGPRTTEPALPSNRVEAKSRRTKIDSLAPGAIVVGTDDEDVGSPESMENYDLEAAVDQGVLDRADVALAMRFCAQIEKQAREASVEPMPPSLRSQDLPIVTEDGTIRTKEQLGAVVRRAAKSVKDGRLTVPEIAGFQQMAVVGGQYGNMSQGGLIPGSLRALDGGTEMGRAPAMTVSETGEGSNEVGDGGADGLRNEVRNSVLAIRRGFIPLSERPSGLTGLERARALIKKHYQYRYEWYYSPNALVRLWGQLDCGIRGLTDECLVSDFLEVFGDDLFKLDGQTDMENCSPVDLLSDAAQELKFALQFNQQKKDDAGYIFQFLVSNVAALKAQILVKYTGYERMLMKMLEKKATLQESSNP